MSMCWRFATRWSRRPGLKPSPRDRKSTRLNSSHRYLHLFPYTTLFRSDAKLGGNVLRDMKANVYVLAICDPLVSPARIETITERSEEHTSELQSPISPPLSLHDALPI